MFRNHYFNQTQGVIAIVFSLLLSPFMMLVSGALDFSNVSYVETQLAYAADAAAIAAARYNLADSIKLANQIYIANYSGSKVKKEGSPSITVSNDLKTITVTASQPISPLIGFLTGSSNSNRVDVTSVTERVITEYELALVLDVTGSMSSSGKMGGIISAAQNVITILSRGKPQIPDGLVSIIPFVACVNIGAEFKNWVIPKDGDKLFPKSAPWEGCVMARPNNLNDGENPPDAGLFPIYYTDSTYQQYGTQKGDNDWALDNKENIIVWLLLRKPPKRYVLSNDGYCNSFLHFLNIRYTSKNFKIFT